MTCGDIGAHLPGSEHMPLCYVAGLPQHLTSLELAKLLGKEVALNDADLIEVVQHAAHAAGDGQLALM